METISLVPAEAKRKLAFEYDWQGRRIAKKVYDWDANQSAFSLQPSAFSLFLYDGWNLLVELTSDLRPLTSFLWGLDLSGSLQVGGLLQFTRHSSPATYHFASYDGNGNVTTLIDATGGSISARYEYGPFGEPIRMTGVQSHTNPFHWPTKYTDDETDLVYYGYRYYNCSPGRWLNRDLLAESGALNLYGFTHNDGINGMDRLGQDDYTDQWADKYSAAMDQADALANKVSDAINLAYSVNINYQNEPTSFSYNRLGRICRNVGRLLGQSHDSAQLRWTPTLGPRSAEIKIESSESAGLGSRRFSRCAPRTSANPF